MNHKEFVFIEAKFLQGVSQKTGNPYEIRKISFADPLTFENHQLDYTDQASFSHLRKGQRITLETELQTQFNRDSKLVVTGAVAVK